MVTYGGERTLSDGLRERNAFSSSCASVMFGNGASFTPRVTPRRVCVRRRRAVSSRSSFGRSGLMVLGGFGDGNRSGSLLSGDSGLPLGRGRHHHTTIRPLLDKGATRGHTDIASVPAGEVTRLPNARTT